MAQRKETMCRYTYFPLYDNKKNSYIRRYRLWMRYRDFCKKNCRRYVDVKTFGKIIEATQILAAHYLIIDPDGVKFKKFRLRLELAKTRNANSFFLVHKQYLPIVTLKTTNNVMKRLRINFWKLALSYDMKLKIIKYMNENPDKMFNYNVVGRYYKMVDDNFFNDF